MAFKLFKKKAKHNAEDDAPAASVAGGTVYRGWTVAPDDGSGVYVATKPPTAGSLASGGVLSAPSLQALQVQIDAAEAPANAPVASYAGWAIYKAAQGVSGSNPFAAGGGASGPLYTARNAAQAWPARLPHTLPEVYAIIDRIGQGVVRPQDPLVRTYQGWNVRQTEDDGRYYAQNPSTGQNVGGMPTLAQVLARIDQYQQQMLATPQVPYYSGQPGFPNQPGYYPTQPRGETDVFGNPVQAYGQQTQTPYYAPQQLPPGYPQPVQASYPQQMPAGYPQPMPASYARPMPQQAAQDYGYEDAGADDDATYTGTNGLGAPVDPNKAMMGIWLVAGLIGLPIAWHFLRRSRR